jgi:monovalent cation:H+ antiporter-2, CPA2 family
VLSVVARFGTRWVSRLVGTRDEEIVVVLALGLAMSTAGMGERLGVSDAIGAFMIGLILSATPVAERLRSLTHPLRDGFGAIFFFHFGLTIDLGDVVTVVPQILVAAGATVLLTVTAGVVAARLHGFGREPAANIGLTVLSRGEFSLVLASLALGAGLDPRIGSFAAGYVLVLAVLGPVAVSSSGRLSRLLPRRLLPEHPRPRRAVPLELDRGTSSLHELGTDLLQVRVLPGSRLHGVYLNELRLPPGATAGLVSRDGCTFAVAPETRLQTHDVLLVFTDPRQRQATEQRILAVHRSGRLASWLGDTGT